jgi:leucyl aminopeptidase
MKYKFGFSSIVPTVSTKDQKYISLIDMKSSHILPFILDVFRQYYTFDKYKTGNQKQKFIVFCHPNIKEFYGRLVVQKFGNDLASEPSNKMTPRLFCKHIVDDFSRYKVKVKILNEFDMKSLGMNLILSVGSSSVNKPKLLIGECSGSGRIKRTIVLVGKGVTFDTGGVNLKVIAWQELVGMKKDMGGAAGVLGAMLTIGRLKPSINVVGVTPLTTNQLGSGAIHPGDIFRSFSGKTVEIQNTDAEGRLILADALHYAVTEKADWIVDAATCCVALGIHNTGLFSNHAGFSETVRATAEAAGEPAWPMPMSPRYGAELKSKLADLGNMGKGRDGGATLGAKFLENFVANTPWVHMDIAATVDLGEPAAAGAQLTAAGRMVHTFSKLAEELSR